MTTNIDESTTAPSESTTASPDGPELAMVPVADLAEHPDNVRTDKKVTARWVASIKAGIRQPLIVNRHPDGRLEVVDGARRLAGAVEAKVETVPCIIEDPRAKRPGADYLDMYTVNEEREGLTELEKAQALFKASKAGYGRGQIRKATGLDKSTVDAALTAATMKPDTRDGLGDYEWTLPELALITEFEDDEAALERLRRAKSFGQNLTYSAERIRQERAIEAEHQQLVAKLAEDGYAVTEVRPAGARRLDELTQDGTPLTAESHAACPGRGVFFTPYAPLEPVHYCADPDSHGHTYEASKPVSNRPDGSGTSPYRKDGPSPRLVRQANVDYRSATKARHEFITELIARRTPPAQLHAWVTEQILSMPEPLRKWLGEASDSELFGTFSGHSGKYDAAAAHRQVAACTAKRLPALMLAAIAAAYERGLTKASEHQNTWRTDRWSPVSREDAAAWLSLLASAGHVLAPIEQAIVDGKAYQGDQSGGSLTDDQAEPDADAPVATDTPTTETETAETT